MVADPQKTLYDQKQMVEWAWQDAWDAAHEGDTWRQVPANLRAAFERERAEIEKLRGN